MTGTKDSKPCDQEICYDFSDKKEWMEMDGNEKRLSRPSLLLHSCCGPCSTSVIERLAPDYEITVFFYNPNITDEEEYEKRKETQLLFIEKYNEDPENPYTIGFKEGPYDRKNYYAVCEGLESAPEGGRRCQECFRMRLKKTAEEASLLGYDTFATTLTVSPHKDYGAISSIGKRMAALYGIGFLDIDFKRKQAIRGASSFQKNTDYTGRTTADANSQITA